MANNRKNNRRTNRNSSSDYVARLTLGKGEGNAPLTAETRPSVIGQRGRVLYRLLESVATDIRAGNETVVAKKVLRSGRVRLQLSGETRHELVIAVERGDGLVQNEEGFWVESEGLSDEDRALAALEKAKAVAKALETYGEFAKQVCAAVNRPETLPMHHPDVHYRDAVRYVYGSKIRDQWVALLPKAEAALIAQIESEERVALGGEEEALMESLDRVEAFADIGDPDLIFQTIEEEQLAADEALS